MPTPAQTYPEVNVQIASAAKLSVADLEGHRHSVFFVQALVEAFPAVSWQLYVVRSREARKQ
jgi:hypothetical protein